MQACGSEDGKKRSESADAGAGGEGGVIEAAAGGSSAGEPTLGTAGEPQATGGMGGTSGAGGDGPLPSAGAGGAGGEPPIVVLPDLELLFSVKPGAEGLDGTALFETPNPQNQIFSSKTGDPRKTPGTNAVAINGELLGLDPTDQIVAFALPQPEPVVPTYLFSVSEGSQGALRTRAWVADTTGSSEGNVYLSDGEQSFRDFGEGGDDMGYNLLLASESSLGLAALETADDLTGLSIHDANVPITEVYFVVHPEADGVTGTAVATTSPLAKGCTVFKSSLDGKNSVAFTCAQLGLFVPIDNVEAVGDQIDALAIYGTSAPSKVVFSVAKGSSGADGSGVATAQSTLAYQLGAALFTSDGDGNNTLLREPHDLGLAENATDDLDGLAVIDSSTGSADKVGGCELSFNPLEAATGGGLVAISGVTQVGNSLVIAGWTSNQTNRWLAYDPGNCAFLQQLDLPSGFDILPRIAAVQLAGWTANKPLDKVELWKLETDTVTVKLSRYDGTGTFAQSFPITDTPYSQLEGLIYDPPRDRFYVLTYGNTHELRAVPRPAASVESITVAPSTRTHPCDYSALASGVDAKGNLVLAAPQRAGKQLRVCRFGEDGELLLAPYWWKTGSNINAQGFLAADGSHYLAHLDATPISIERALYHYP